MKSPHWTWGLLVLLGFAHAAKASPILFTDAQKDAQVMQEAVLTSYFQVGNLFGASPGNPLSITTGIFSDSGWSFSLTGTYLGVPVNLGLSGSYDAVTGDGTFTSSGLVGATSVSGQGSWSWADVGSDEEDLNFASGLTSLESRIESDTETVPLFGPKRFVKVFEDHYYIYVEDFGTFAETQDGNPTGQFVEQESGERLPKFVVPFPPPPPPPEPQPDPNVEIVASLGSGNLTATEDDTQGTVTGTVSTVPEPATLLCVATGLAGLGAVWRRRRETAPRRFRGASL
jgi:PEP-CTERM motif